MSGCPSRVTSLAWPSSTASSVPMWHMGSDTYKFFASSVPMCHSPCDTWGVTHKFFGCIEKCTKLMFVFVIHFNICLGVPAESPPWHDRVPLLKCPHESLPLSCFRISWCFKLIAYSNDNISTHACFECEPPFIKYLITLITRKVLSK